MSGKRKGTDRRSTSELNCNSTTALYSDSIKDCDSDNIADYKVDNITDNTIDNITDYSQADQSNVLQAVGLVFRQQVDRSKHVAFLMQS